MISLLTSFSYDVRLTLPIERGCLHYCPLNLGGPGTLVEIRDAI